MRIEIITAPAVEPITLAEAKTFCRVDPDLTVEDALITELISAARRQLEVETGRAYAVQTVRAVFDRFPLGRKFLPVPRFPLISVDSLTYIDSDGAEQTVDAADYRVETGAMPGGIFITGTWPVPQASPGAVRVQYQCGYTATDGEGEEASELLPGNAKMAMLFLINHYFENRDTVIVGSIATPLPLAFSSLARTLKVYYEAPDLYDKRVSSTTTETWL